MTLEPLHGPSGPEPTHLSGALTEEQRAFAQVVGQALAEAWRRQWQEAAEKQPVSDRPDYRLSQTL